MAFDMNRDAACQCISAAHHALSQGDITKAQRLLERSRRMYPLRSQQDSLARFILQAQGATQNGVDKGRERRRKVVEEEVLEEEEMEEVEEVKKVYTKEQIRLVKRVNRASCFYEVLGLKKGDVKGDVATSVRKKYKLLALKLHPDKNNAPGSDEAFKKVAQAFQVLSDEKSRDRYDRFGMRGVEGVGGGGGDGLRRRRRRRHGDGFGGMNFGMNGMNGFAFTSSGRRGEFGMSPEELFEFLFTGRDFMTQSGFGGVGGGAMRSGRNGSASAHLFRERAQREYQESHDGWFGLRGIIAVILFLLYIILLSGPSDPGYSFQRTSYYNHARETKSGVFYYVPGSQYTMRQWRKLDYSADNAALASLFDECERERDDKNYLLRKARGLFTIGREKYRKKYEAYKTPHCDQYASLRTRIKQSRAQ